MLKTANASGQAAGVAVKAVDTTGAGDAYIGSLLWYLKSIGVTVKDLPELTEAELSEGAAFANKYCAVTITKPGAIPSYPSLQEFKNIYK